MIARRLERVSDQARNIGMETLYMCTGEIAKHPGSDVFKVLFVDEHNACRSLMAEAIGTALQEPGFVFSSAGLDPLPLQRRDHRASWPSKGFDVTRAVPRALTQRRQHRPRGRHRAARARGQAAPSPAARATRCCSTGRRRPDRRTGTRPRCARRYEQAYAFIEAQIRDLVSAIRDSNRA